MYKTLQLKKLTSEFPTLSEDDINVRQNPQTVAEDINNLHEMVYEKTDHEVVNLNFVPTNGNYFQVLVVLKQKEEKPKAITKTTKSSSSKKSISKKKTDDKDIIDEINEE